MALTLTQKRPSRDLASNKPPISLVVLMGPRGKPDFDMRLAEAKCLSPSLPGWRRRRTSKGLKLPPSPGDKEAIPTVESAETIWGTAVCIQQ